MQITRVGDNRNSEAQYLDIEDIKFYNLYYGCHQDKCFGNDIQCNSLKGNITLMVTLRLFYQMYSKYNVFIE